MPTYFHFLHFLMEVLLSSLSDAENARYLSYWLLFAAFLRAFAVVLGYAFPSLLRQNVFSVAPEGAYSALTGRTFSIWTAVTCLVCIFTSAHIQNDAMLALCLGTFLLAEAYFMLELLAYRTVSIRTALGPFIIASSFASLWLVPGGR